MSAVQSGKVLQKSREDSTFSWTLSGEQFPHVTESDLSQVALARTH